MPKLLPHVVEVETDRPAFPDVCVCCGADAETTYRPEPPQRRPGMPEEGPLVLPYCNFCLAHMKASQILGTARMVALNIAVWGMALVMIVGAPTPLLAAGPGLAAGYLFNARRVLDPAMKTKETCSTSGRAMRAVWYRRTTYFFSFSSESYAKAFRDLNKSLLTPEENPTP